MTVRAQGQVRLRDLGHIDGRLHAALDPLLQQKVLQRERIHHRAEHAHVIRAGTVHAPLGQLRAAEEVAAANDDGDFGAGACHGSDLLGHVFYHVRVNTHFAAAEHLPAQLEHDPLVALAVGAFGWFKSVRARHGSTLSFVSTAVSTWFIVPTTLPRTHTAAGNAAIHTEYRENPTAAGLPRNWRQAQTGWGM